MGSRGGVIVCFLPLFVAVPVEWVVLLYGVVF